jgi:hypothetical protein
MSRKRIYRLLGLFSLAGYAWLAWNGAGLVSGKLVPGVCMFKSIMHIPCPSCGATRAILLFLHGNIVESLLLNPLGALLFIALIVVPIWLLADVLLKRESLFRFYNGMENTLRKHVWISVPLIAIVLVNWFWNIAKGL